MCLMLRDTARVASVHALPATISNPAFARPSLSGAPHSIFESSHITTADRPAAGANGLAPPVPFISRRDGGSYSVICWYGPFPIAPLIQLGGSSLSPQASRARRQPR